MRNRCETLRTNLVLPFASFKLMCAEVSALISVENKSLTVCCRRDLRPYSSSVSDNLLLPEPTGGRESSLAVRGTRQDEYYARTQALVGGPAEPVQCGEKRS